MVCQSVRPARCLRSQPNRMPNDNHYLYFGQEQYLPLPISECLCSGNGGAATGSLCDATDDLLRRDLCGHRLYSSIGEQLFMEPGYRVEFNDVSEPDGKPDGYHNLYIGRNDDGYRLQ